MTRSQVQDRSPDHHGRMHARFGWEVPTYFNIAQACCVRWSAAPDTAQRVAIVADGPQQRACAWTYAQLQEASNRLANALAQLGVQRGDRVAIVMPQRFETAVAYIAVLQVGAVAMPLSMLFGPEALEFRLRDSEAVAAVCDGAAAGRISAVRAACPALRRTTCPSHPDSLRRPRLATVRPPARQRRARRRVSHLRRKSGHPEARSRP